MTEIHSHMRYIHKIHREKNSLADLARDLERTLLRFLTPKHLGGDGGSSGDPTQVSSSLCLLLLLRLCLLHSCCDSPLPLLPLKQSLSLFSHTHIHSCQHSGSPSQTGEQVCHRPDIHLAEDRTDLFPALSFLALPFHQGLDTLSDLSQGAGAL